MNVANDSKCRAVVPSDSLPSTLKPLASRVESPYDLAYGSVSSIQVVVTGVGMWGCGDVGRSVAYSRKDVIGHGSGAPSIA